MSVLENPRHELYCQHRARGLNMKDSYIAAKFEASEDAVHSGASRLELKPGIKERIRELQIRNIKRGQVTKFGIIDMLVASQEAATKDKQHSVAVRAAELMGKELGMFVERHEVNRNIWDETKFAEFERLRDKLISEAARRIAQGDGDLQTLSEVRHLLPAPRPAET